MGLSLTVHHLDLGVFILFYYYVYSSPTCVLSSLWVWASSCTEALFVTWSVSDSTFALRPIFVHLLQCSQFCHPPPLPLCLNFMPHVLFLSEIFLQSQFFKILIRLFLRALGRKCFSFSPWESVGFKLSASARTSWCHGRLTPPGLRSTDTKWAVSSCFLCSCFPTSLV